MQIENITAINVSKQLIKILPRKMKIALGFLLSGMVLKAILETATMGLLAFFAAALSKPDQIINSTYVLFLRNSLGLEFLSTIKGFIIGFSIIIVVVVFIKNLFKAYLTFLMGRYHATVEAFLGKSLISGFLKMPYHWYINQNSADLVYAIEIRKQIGRKFINSVLKLSSDFILIFFMLAGLLLLQPLVSLLVLFVLGVTGYLIFRNIRAVIDRIAKRCQQYEQKINKDCTKAIHGIKDVKIFGRESFFVDESQTNLLKFARLFGIYKFFELSPSVILETVGFIMLTTTICLMMFVLNASPVNVAGTIALLAVAAWKCLPAMERILKGSAEIRYSLPFISTVLFYFDEIKQNAPDTESSATGDLVFNSELVMDQIDFRYPKSEFNILSSIHIRVKKGETIGIIGPSGAGKSTLVDLITGLLIPSKGKIFIDELELDPTNTKKWREKIGYVSQFPYIYDGTLAENVAFGAHPATIDRNKIKNCCTMAYMDEFLKDLPNGIDTEIGERGIRLSGGQRQRVAIARALYYSPSIMIFDEATSSLDTKSEAEIKKTIYSLKEEKTLIIIAHRLTTVEDCDRIYWLEKGRIKDAGSSEKIIPMYRLSEF
ncbi:ABC transporter ATP-binding protein [Desulfotignum balticum]|uniref:ABC transporter ATP-binding protein n=1 Tax=Desulfotignum balticum TaxID=115781 RepID=UPI0003FFEF81|nr:ABC transporter ATP-binding protein/permease [Desulfotignum balticum]